MDKKDKVENIEEQVEDLVNKDRDKNLPNIKRMVATLDRFLNRRIAGIAILFMAVLVACGVGLIVNGSNVYASTGGQTTINNTSVWLYSIFAVFAFLFIIILARVFVYKSRNRV